MENEANNNDATVKMDPVDLLGVGGPSIPEKDSPCKMPIFLLKYNV